MTGASKPAVGRRFGAPRRGRGSGLCRYVHSVFWRVASWERCEGGVAVVEFALIAPILAFTLLASIDLGLAVSQRMAIEDVLRAGAQSAMADPGETTVLDVMRATAQPNFTLAGATASTAQSDLTLSVSRFAACPEDPGFAVAASKICAGSKPTFIYYRMSASKTYTGWIAPAIQFDRAVQVQIR